MYPVRNPFVGAFVRMVSFRLCNLVSVMRKRQVHSSSVYMKRVRVLKLLLNIFYHGGTFNVPARSSFTPR